MIRNNWIFDQLRMKFLYVMFFTVATKSGLLLLFLTSIINCSSSSSNSENLVSIQLDFLVFGPNELLIKINGFPKESFDFITLRLGVRRSNQDLEDLEYGDNYLKNGNFYINDNRLQLKTGDTINYLIAYRNSDGYHAKTGKFTFDGDYRNRRIRRSISNNIILIDETVNESANARIPRHHQQYDGVDFNPWGTFKHNSFGGPRGPPPFGGGGGGPPFGAPPPFSDFSPFEPHHHQHHHQHGNGKGRGPPFGHNHHQFCNSSEEDGEDEDQSTTSRISTTTTTTPATTTKTITTTTTEFYPDIDIRFGN